MRKLRLQGQQTGRIREDAGLEAAVSALLGPFYADCMAGRGSHPRWAEQAVDLGLTGLGAGA